MKTFEYTIKDSVGIHARPAGLLVKEIKRFGSKVTISKGEKTVDGSEKDLGSPTVIEWLNSYTLDKNADTSGELPSAFFRFFHENVKNFSRVILIKIILRFLDTFGYIDLY